MQFTPLSISGAYLVDLEFKEDDRGSFARTWCQEEFAALGLAERFVQCSLSRNLRRGTLRGMHYQAEPHAEAKLVRCVRGAIYDVVLDLRRDSPTFCQWAAVELTDINYRALYLPRGCAHGFQTLEDDSEIFYQISDFYAPEAARGVRWNDPRFAIDWPLAAPVMSDRDRNYPDFQG